MNSNLVLENGQFLMQKQANSSNMQMYVGDGVTALSGLNPVGLLPDVLSRMIFIYNKEEGMQIPIVIADENGNVVFPGVPVQGGGSGGIGSSAEVGEVRSFLLTTPPSGWLECDGALCNEADYPDLYIALQALDQSLGLIIDANTFYLPDLRGRFLRGQEIGRAIASTQEDALQNITGSMWDNNSANLGGNGAFYRITPGSGDYTGNTANSRSYSGVTFDASRVARTDVETRPKNLSALYCIKY